MTAESALARNIRCVVIEKLRNVGLTTCLIFQDRLFKQFTQLDDSVTRRFGGTGLVSVFSGFCNREPVSFDFARQGLNIVKKLTALKGGDVWLDEQGGRDLKSIEGLSEQGATFRFRVKVQTYTPSKWKGPEVEQAPKLNETSSTVFLAIIDDHQLNNTALRKDLEDIGVDSNRVSVFSDFASFLDSDVAVNGLIVDLRTLVSKEEAQSLRRTLKNGPRGRILLLCTPALNKAYRKQLRLGKSADVTALLRPAKAQNLIRFLNELPMDTVAPEDLRDVLRSIQSRPASGALDARDVDGKTKLVPLTTTMTVESRLTPLATATTDLSSNATRVGEVPLEDSYSSDSSLAAITTPAQTPQLEFDVPPLAPAAGSREDYFSLSVKEERKKAVSIAESTAEAAPPAAPKARPAAPDVFVETKTGPMKLPSFKVLVVEGEWGAVAALLDDGWLMIWLEFPDNAINRAVTGRLLQRLGQRYEFAEDGFEGEHLSLVFFDVTFTDQMRLQRSRKSPKQSTQTFRPLM